MSNRIVENIKCKEAHKLFVAYSKDVLSVAEHEAVGAHIEGCARCAEEYRIVTLCRTALDLAATPEVITPDNDFFIGLRARIARGAQQFEPQPSEVDDSWAAALWVSARQLIPAMAILLLLILGATMLWRQSATPTRNQSPQYEAVEPSPVDVVDSSVIIADERFHAR